MRPTSYLPWLLAVVTSLGLVAIGAVVIRNVEQTRSLLDATTRVATTLELRGQLDDILLRTTEAETGQRGYLLTGESHHLQVYQQAVGVLPSALDRLEEATRSNPAQQARLQELRAAVLEKLTELAHTLELSQRGERDAALAIVRTHRGEAAIDRLRGIVGAMTREEESRLRDSRLQAGAAWERARRGRIGSGLLSGLLLAGVALLGFVLFRLRERTAHQADAEREHLSVTLASIGDGVIATDLQGRVTLINTVAEALTGQPAAEAIGRPVTDVFTAVGEAPIAPTNPVMDVLTSGAPAQVRAPWRLMGRDGQAVPIDASAAPIRSVDGATRGAVIVFRDVSGVRAHERALADSEARYRSAAAAAQSARAEAEQANRLKDEFLAVLSHELRTPLNAVLGWAQILLGGQTTPVTLARGLGSIKRNAEAQQRLVEDLLDVSRIITGKFPIERKPSALRPVIASAVDALGPMAGQRQVQMQVSLSDGAIADVDPYRLQQVATNLLSNAVKFTPPGGAIAVTLTHADGVATFCVRDSGQGIASDLLPHIFDRFRQGDGSFTRAHGGLGLGLAIARHIVESHGGRIAVHSEGIGKGATFTVTLPLLDGQTIPQALRHVRAAYDGTGGERLRGRRVLVVEDETDARELMSWALQEAGADVVVAGDGVEALGLLSAEPPDVVLTDVHMPRMDGFRLVGAMRERIAGRVPPTIAISARAGHDQAVRAMEAGFAAHLTKPIDLNLLLDTIDQVMAS